MTTANTQRNSKEKRIFGEAVKMTASGRWGHIATPAILALSRSSLLNGVSRRVALETEKG
ncbi:unnamed protein product [Clavelina lepadiformis]|uniref:Uncharacterized protein n=1 Tax=Clavelina lepadiformis TaxID=159417 RepID=A0ABP0G756_CLALP